MNKLIKNIKSPRKALWSLWLRCSRFISSDTFYLKVFYRLHMREKLDLKNPKTFNQKLQWLKLHYNDERFAQMVDKYGVREIIRKKIGEEFLIPLLGVWDKFNDIDFNKLPNQFILKATHDSGSYIICKEKSTFNINNARRRLSRKLRRNYFYWGREYPYKNVTPRIIAEKYIVDESRYELKDYKFFCFNGVPQLFYVVTDRNTGNPKFDFFDKNFNHLPFTSGYENSNKPFRKPENFEKMLEIAGILSKDIPHVRVDLYNVNGKIYFSEFTFHHNGGVFPFKPAEWDKKLGDLIKLPLDKE